jgi:hypothetical protein
VTWHKAIVRFPLSSPPRDQPTVVLTLRWIAEFEVYAEEDEEAFLDLKAWLKSRNDPEAASVLRFVIEFEETVELDPRLKRFQDWLQAKGSDRSPGTVVD